MRNAGVHVLDGVEAWLLGQDVAVEFPTRRDLSGQFDAAIQKRIGREVPARYCFPPTGSP